MGKSKFWYFCTQKYPKTNFGGWKYQFWVVLRPNRPKFGKSNMWTFSKKNPTLNGYSFLIYLHFCENWPDPKKTTFSHFLQNTVLDPKSHKILKIFEKFRFWAFRKVYALGLFPAQKKLFPFEIPIYHCYSPLFWIFIYTRRIDWNLNTLKSLNFLTDI